MLNIKNLFFLSLVFISAFLIILSYFSISNKDKFFITDLKSCNKLGPALRFSCYRAALQKYYGGRPEELIQKVKTGEFPSLADYGKNQELSYAVFGTNCHSFYHAYGDFVSSNVKNEDISQLTTYCPSKCTNGCIMGLYKRKSLRDSFSSNLLKKLYKVCPKDSLHQCAHEIGHLLHDKYVYSILKTLDDIAEKKFGLKLKEKFRYVTFGKTDLNKPFEECRQVLPEKEWPYCYTGIGHNLFLFSEFSPDGYRSMFEECAKTSDKNRNDCHAFLIYRIGINEAGPRFLAGKIEEGKKICDDAVKIAKRPDLTQHCYLGIGGGIGLYIDSEFTPTKLTDQNLAIMQRKVVGLIELCEKVPSQFLNNCLAGLMGTPFRKYYEKLNLNYFRIEEIKPKLDKDFQVVG